MTDFRLSGRVEVDASQALPALDKTRAGVDAVTSAERELTAASAQAAGATDEQRNAMAQLGASLDAARAEIARMRAEATQATQSLTEQAARIRALETSLRAFQGTQQRGVGSTRQQAAAMQQLGVQFGDFTQQLSLGTPFLLAFAQQAGQAAGAASQLGGAAGAVGRFFAGPWGSILLAAGTVAGTLAFQMMGAGDAASDMTSKQDELARFVDKTTGAINRQISATQRLASAQRGRAQLEGLKDDYGDARQELIDAVRRGAKTESGGNDPRVPKVVQITPAQAQAQALVEQYAKGKIGADALANSIRRLANSAPELGKLSERVTELAATAIDRAQEVEKKRGDIALRTGLPLTDLQKRLLEVGQADASLIQKQVALATATTPLERAQAAYNLVLDRGSEAAKQGGAALEQYRRDLTEAANAVNAAEAAERSAREAVSARRRETRAAASEERALAELRKRGAAEAEKLKADFNKDATDAMIKGQQDAMRGLGPEFEKALTDAGDRGWQAFEDRGAVAITAVGQALGGQLGEAAAQFGALLQGAASGNFTALGGRKGGLLSIASGALSGASKDLWKPQPYTIKRPDGTTTEAMGLSKGNLALAGQGKIGDIFAANFQDKFKEPFKALTGKLEGLFGSKGGTFAATAGKAFAGAAQGSIASGVAGALGIKQSGAGAQIGGALGSLIPGLGPFGGMIGGLLGGTLGGLLGSVKKGSATVTGSNGAVSVGDAVGNSSGFKKAAESMGNSVSDAVEALVAQLGGEIGNFSVSLGRRDKKFTVDSSGNNKTKGAGVQKFKDESEAVQAALADAIRDGAVAGVSPRVQSVLKQYADNINKAVAEAMKVRSLEDLLANQKNPFATLFRDFDQVAKQRLDTAKKYGFDVVEIERINGEERARLVKDTLERSTASVKQLLDDLRFGGRATGTAVDKRNSLAAERDRLAQLARGGDQSAIDKLASISQQLLDADREAFGTAGGNPASRAETIGVLEELVAMTERRIAEASKPQADAAAQKLDTTNAQLDEANDQLAVIAARLDRLVGGTDTGFGYRPTIANPGVVYTSGGGLLRDVGATVRQR